MKQLAYSASAGCGKTEILSKRLLLLLLQNPDRVHSIAALTFSRAAAGEIYERLIALICQSAISAPARKSLAADLKRLDNSEPIPELTEHAMCQLLAKVIQAGKQLNIGTLDSFLLQICRVFPMELGMPGKVDLADEALLETFRNNLLRKLFSGSDDPDETEDFLAVVRESFAAENTKCWFDLCLDTLADFENFFSNTMGQKIPSFVSPCSQEALQQAWKQLKTAPWPAKSGKHLSLLEKCATADLQTHFSREEKDLLNKAFDCGKDFFTGAKKPSGWSFNRSYSYTADMLQNLKVLLTHARMIILAQSAASTSGLQKLCQRYRQLYNRELQKNGKLFFSDLPRLLNQSDNAWLPEISFRLNSRLQHFLLDEFQDTSRDQWQILERIIDDVHDGEHSLFVVGDVKQAIYGWRGGDSSLLDQVIKDFDLKKRPLDRSYRYGEGICNALNQLFTSLVPEIFTPEACHRWNQIWNSHHSAPNRPQGEFTVIAPEIPSVEGEKLSWEQTAALVIYHQLKQLNLPNENVDCAVLVHTNDSASKIYNALSELDDRLIDELCLEGNSAITDSPICRGLLSLAVYLQHPGDTGAKELLLMTRPLHHLLPQTKEEFDEQNFMIAHYGYAKFFRHCLQKVLLKTDALMDDIIVDTFLTLASRFDKANPQPDALLLQEFIRNNTRSDVAAKGKIRIMTIHHSKGLGVDVLFYLPQAKRPRSSGRQLISAPEGILFAPAKAAAGIPWCKEAMHQQQIQDKFHELCTLYVAVTRGKRGVYLLLPPLSNEDKRNAFDKHKNARALFSILKEQMSYNLCDQLYNSFFSTPYLNLDPVVFCKDEEDEDEIILPYEAEYLNKTFAVQIPRLSKFSQMFQDNVTKLIEWDTWPVSTFSQKVCVESKVYHFGKPLVPEDFPKQQQQTSLPRLVPHSTTHTPLRRKKPSDADRAHAMGYYFSPPGAGTDLGDQIHAFFMQVGNLEEFVPPADTPEQVLAHYKAVMENKDARMLLSDSCSDLWREQSFEVIYKGQWLSGTFDRVQIYRDDDGKVVKATIIDYKSNQIPAPESLQELRDHYRFQMQIYRRSLSTLLGIPQDDISLRLLFTRIGKVVHVDD